MVISIHVALAAVPGAPFSSNRKFVFVGVAGAASLTCQPGVILRIRPLGGAF